MNIFFTKEWAGMFAEKEGGIVDTFELVDGGKIISYTFIKREINKLPFAKNFEKKYYDIISPYGYGGIYISKAVAREPDFIRRFKDEFNNYCIENNVVAEFIRFHPLQKNYMFFRDFYSLRHVNDNVYVDLRQADGDILKNIAKRHRYCIRKARAKGININFNDDFKSIDDFIKLYKATNDGNKAIVFYYFGKDFFNKLRGFFGNKVRLVTASLDNKIISTALFIFDEKEVYYFLSGTNKLGYDVLAGHLLLNEAIFKAKQEGKKLFNLGGGLKKNDSVFLFKSGFSNTTAPYYVGTAIRMPDIYKKLLDMSGADPLVDYFPKYRHKS